MLWINQIINNNTFFKLLYQLDKEEFKKLYKKPCPVCGEGVLHKGNYRRKPRGFRFDIEDEYLKRFSLCCSKEGCRCRRTPASVRFLDKKVYLGAIIILIMCLRYGPNRMRLKGLSEIFGPLSLRTINRWREYWQEYFPESDLCKSLQGYLNFKLNFHDLPMQVIKEYERINGRSENTILSVLNILMRGPPAFI